VVSVDWPVAAPVSSWRCPGWVRQRGRASPRRRTASRRLRPGDAILGPRDVYRHLHPRLRDARCERFLVLVLDGRHRLVREFQASQGTLTASLVHPREVFRPALVESGAAVVLAHNHPSGDPTPSPEDRSITERLVRAGHLLGVPVVDHVVVAERGFTSLREEGRCDFDRVGEAPAR
jgi:DNA repair protein RadC